MSCLCELLCVLLVRAPLCLVCASSFGLHSVRNSNSAVDDIILRSICLGIAKTGPKPNCCGKYF